MASKETAKRIESQAPNGMSHALARGTHRRTEDESFRADLDDLDRVMAEPGTRLSWLPYTDSLADTK